MKTKQNVLATSTVLTALVLVIASGIGCAKQDTKGSEQNQVSQSSSLSKEEIQAEVAQYIEDDLRSWLPNLSTYASEADRIKIRPVAEYLGSFIARECAGRPDAQQIIKAFKADVSARFEECMRSGDTEIKNLFLAAQLATTQAVEGSFDSGPFKHGAASGAVLAGLGMVGTSLADVNAVDALKGSLAKTPTFEGTYAVGVDAKGLRAALKSHPDFVASTQRIIDAEMQVALGKRLGATEAQLEGAVKDVHVAKLALRDTAVRVKAELLGIRTLVDAQGKSLSRSEYIRLAEEHGFKGQGFRFWRGVGRVFVFGSVAAVGYTTYELISLLNGEAMWVPKDVNAMILGENGLTDAPLPINRRIHSLPHL